MTCIFITIALEVMVQFTSNMNVSNATKKAQKDREMTNQGELQACCNLDNKTISFV